MAHWPFHFFARVDDYRKDNKATTFYWFIRTGYDSLITFIIIEKIIVLYIFVEIRVAWRALNDRMLRKKTCVLPKPSDSTF